MKTIYKKLLYTATGLPIIRNIAKPWQGRACILCYHRIDNNLKTKQDSHPNGNLISESAFYNQMQVLSNEYDVLSMDEMSEHLSGPSSDFKVAVTFEDGKHLIFGDPKNRKGPYNMLAGEWTNNKGKLQYGDKVYYTNSASSNVHLEFKMRKLNKYKKAQRVVKGKKL